MPHPEKYANGQAEHVTDRYAACTRDLWFLMDFPISNSGRYAVRLTQVRSPGHDRLFKQTVVMMDAGHGGTAVRPFRPCSATE